MGQYAYPDRNTYPQQQYTVNAIPHQQYLPINQQQSTPLQQTSYSTTDRHVKAEHEIGTTGAKEEEVDEFDVFKNAFLSEVDTFENAFVENNSTTTKPEQTEQYQSEEENLGQFFLDSLDDE